MKNCPYSITKELKIRQELDEKLVRDFPKIFRDRHGNMRETAMCWGFQCGDGWFDLIYELCSLLQHYTDTRYQESTGIKRFAAEILRIARNVSYHLPGKPFLGTIFRWYVEMRKGDKHPQVVATTVKEKFGTLRFYTCGDSDEQHAIIEMVENLSGKICEVCGTPGELRGRMWVLTLCDRHWKQARRGK